MACPRVGVGWGWGGISFKRRPQEEQGQRRGWDVTSGRPWLLGQWGEGQESQSRWSEEIG